MTVTEQGRVTIDELAEKIKKLRLLILKQNQAVPERGRRPYPNQFRPSYPLSCTYCGNMGNIEHICYKKQSEERDKARVQDQAKTKVERKKRFVFSTKKKKLRTNKTSKSCLFKRKLRVRERKYGVG